MRVRLLVSITSVAVQISFGCGDSPKGQSVCDNVVPPPVACMTQCDPAPGAPATCPGGYHCSADGTCDALCTPAGGECGDGYRCTGDGRCVGEGECEGLECNVVDCAAMSQPSTTITGTVYAPNGTLPLYGVNVYVPNSTLGPPTAGAVCDRCTDTLPGNPVTKTQTDEMGNFTLTDVPAGANVPIVISVGKWRREITVANVAQCADTPLAATETRLPRNQSEGYLPKIAISTGSADALECLPRKLGIDDSEFGTAGGSQSIHMYAEPSEGANRFRSGFPGGSGMFASSRNALWNSVDSLKPYDIVFLSCEGAQNPDAKPQPALDAMKAYADLGGRVFLSHWHNIWIEGDTEGDSGNAPAVWTSIAQWNNSGTTFDGPVDHVDEVNNPKGDSFATWMLNVGGSPAGMRGVIDIEDSTGKNTCDSVDPQKAEQWVYWDDGGEHRPQMFQFTTPNEQPAEARCGKVVFSDMHVSGDSRSSSGTPFPDDCSDQPLTPQEKALAFMFFDIASCVSGPIL